MSTATCTNLGFAIFAIELLSSHLINEVNTRTHSEMFALRNGWERREWGVVTRLPTERDESPRRLLLRQLGDPGGEKRAGHAAPLASLSTVACSGRRTGGVEPASWPAWRRLCLLQWREGLAGAAEGQC
jgi:hypothetical protein